MIIILRTSNFAKQKFARREVIVSEHYRTTTTIGATSTKQQNETTDKLTTFDLMMI